MAKTNWGEKAPNWDATDMAQEANKPLKAMFAFRKLVIEEVEVGIGDDGQTYGQVLDQMIEERRAAGDKLMTFSLRFPPEPDWDI